MKFCLYSNPDISKKFKGEPVRRMGSFSEEDLFKSNLDSNDYESVMNVLVYLKSTLGISGVHFTSTSGRSFYLEKVSDGND